MSFRDPKHPAESIPMGTDWTDALDVGETVVGTPTVLVVDPGQRVRDPNPSAMLSGGAAVNIAPVTVTDEAGVSRTVAIGKFVSQRIIGGIAGVEYETIWRVVTSTPRTLEERVTLVVR